MRELLEPLTSASRERRGANAGERTLTGKGQNPSVGVGLRIFLDSVILTCFLAGVLALCNKPAAAIDEDLWWHLRTGAWIIQHHAVPTHDIFAAYTNGRPWIEYTWLFDVLVSRIYDVWHLPGVLALTGILILASIAALVALLSRYTALHRAVGLSVGALFGIGTLATPRPWLFTVLFFVLEMYFLLRARERGQAFSLWPVVPLLALWANLHIQYIYGLIVIALFAMESPIARFMKWGPSIARLTPRSYWILFATSALATLANPYGWKLYSVVLQYSTQSVPLSFIQEMQPLQFRALSDWVPLILTCLAAYALADLKDRQPVFVLLLAVSCWFGFRTARDVWFLVIIASLILANSMPTQAKALRRVRWVPFFTALPLSLAVGYSLLQSQSNSDRTLRVALAKRFPEQAAAYIESHALPNPLYNTFDWGGFLIWRLPQMPVSIDGRANLHGDARLQRFSDTWLGKSTWADDAELRKARTILLDRDCPLASILRSDRRFRLVYQDTIASVFQPAPVDTGR